MNRLEMPAIKRRDALIACAATAAGAKAAVAAQQPAPAATPASAALTPVSLTVNGQARQLELDTRTTLLDALREHLHLTGSKKGCDHGQCGACGHKAAPAYKAGLLRGNRRCGVVGALASMAALRAWAACTSGEISWVSGRLCQYLRGISLRMAAILSRAGLKICA